MASEAQRKRVAKIEALDAEEDDLFGDVEVERGTDAEDFATLTKMPKSPLHLLLMVKSPNFPLQADQSLYVNTGNKAGAPLGEMTVLEDGRINTIEGVKTSLANAALPYMQHIYANRPKSSPNGWEVVKVAGVKPGTFVSLNTLFIDHWTTLDVDVQTLQDEDSLARHMVGLGYLTEADVPSYRGGRGQDKPTRATRGKKENR